MNHKPQENEEQVTSGQFLTQDTEIQLLSVCLPHVTQRSFVDVGAERGAFARFLAEQGFRGVCFEPLPKHQEALNALAQQYPVTHHSLACDEHDHQAEFHIACDEDGAPLDYFHSLQLLTGDQRVHHQQKLNVTCRSLKSLCKEGVIEQNLGALKIDTEGNDLRVLRGIGPVRSDVLICEFFTAGIYSGWSEASPGGLIAEARKLGYSTWLAIRRRGAAELVSLCPSHFTEREWGNLIFLSEAVFQSARPQIGEIIAKSEQRVFAALETSAREARPTRKSWKWW
jgi:FkbM family methyltransferase